MAGRERQRILISEEGLSHKLGRTVRSSRISVQPALASPALSFSAIESICATNPNGRCYVGRAGLVGYCVASSWLQF